jgi:hypothetical protein
MGRFISVPVNTNTTGINKLILLFVFFKEGRRKGRREILTPPFIKVFKINLIL